MSDYGRGVIEQIRREKFWLDREGESNARNPLIDDLQASVLHLSEGLYSTETHFVLELIQNAEDNAYDEGTTPTLSMELLETDPLHTPGADGALLISNNERGFRPADVRALCAVGASTKKARKSSGAFIGDKGIGFKSVFVVSARPAIFSNGFHFSFNEEPDECTGLGYIVPSLVHAVPEAVRPHIEVSHTVILLPLKAGKRDKVERELASIAPETLLFLHKIAQLRVVVGGHVTAQVTRVVSAAHPQPTAGGAAADGGDGGHVVSLITRAGGEERRRDYWLAAHEAAVPADVVEPSRAGVDARACAVALPLRSADDGDDGALGALHCSGRVFAFLPTEVHSRVPFLLNADFVLSSSRESIQLHRPWNLWLRECLASAFVRAFLSCLGQRAHAVDAYGFVPLTSSTFFAELRTRALAELAGAACVLVAPRPRPPSAAAAAAAATPGAGGCAAELVLPAHARVAPAALLALLARCAAWPAHVSRGAGDDAAAGAPPPEPAPVALVHADVAALYHAQLDALGARPLSAADWGAILGDADWLGSLSAAQLVELYALLAAEAWATPAALKGLPLLRVEHSAPRAAAVGAGGGGGAAGGSARARAAAAAAAASARLAQRTEGTRMCAATVERPVFAASTQTLPEDVASLLLPRAADGAAAHAPQPLQLMCRSVHAAIDTHAPGVLLWAQEALGLRPLSVAAFVEHAVRSFHVPPLPPDAHVPGAPRGPAALANDENGPANGTANGCVNNGCAHNGCAPGSGDGAAGARPALPASARAQLGGGGSGGGAKGAAPALGAAELRAEHASAARAALQLARGVRELRARGAIDDRCVRAVGPLMPLALEGGLVVRRGDVDVDAQVLVPRAKSAWARLLAPGEDDLHFAVLAPEYAELAPAPPQPPAPGGGAGAPGGAPNGGAVVPAAGSEGGAGAGAEAGGAGFAALCLGALDLPLITPAAVSTAGAGGPGAPDIEFPALALLRRAAAAEGEGGAVAGAEAGAVAGGAPVSAEQAALLAEWLDALLSSGRMGWEEARVHRAPSAHAALASPARAARGAGGGARALLHVTRRPSELKRLLLSAPWLPSSAGARAPSQLFADSAALRDVFGAGLPYCTLQLRPRVAAFLGLPTDASAGALVAHVRRLAAQPADDVEPALVLKLFTALAAASAGVGAGGARAAASAELAEWEGSATLLVRTPRPRWVRAKECVWAAEREIFLGQLHILSLEYPEGLRHYLVEKLGARPHADDSDYAHRWLALSNADAAERPPAPPVLRALWARLATHTAKRGRERERAMPAELWARLCEKGWALTHAMALVPPAEALLPDDSELRGAFEGGGGGEGEGEGGEAGEEGEGATLPFVWAPREGDGSAAPYLQLGAALGVRGVGARAQCAVRAEGVLRGGAALPRDAAADAAGAPAAEGEGEGEGEAELLTPGTKRCIATFLANRLRPDFERLCAAGTMRLLFRTKEVTAARVSVTHTIARAAARGGGGGAGGGGAAEPIVSSREVGAFWDAPRGLLYVGRGGGALAALEVPRALARTLLGDLERAGDFEDFVGRAMLMRDDAAREAILRQKGFVVPSVLGMPAPPDGVEAESERSRRASDAPKRSPPRAAAPADGAAAAGGGGAGEGASVVVHGYEGVDEADLTPSARQKCAAVRQQLDAVWELPDEAEQARALKRLYLEWHPDKRHGDADAVAVFRWLRKTAEAGAKDGARRAAAKAAAAAAAKAAGHGADELHAQRARAAAAAHSGHAEDADADAEAAALAAAAASRRGSALGGARPAQPEGAQLLEMIRQAVEPPAAHAHAHAHAPAHARASAPASDTDGAAAAAAPPAAAAAEPEADAPAAAAARALEREATAAHVREVISSWVDESLPRAKRLLRLVEPGAVCVEPGAADEPGAHADGAPRAGLPARGREASAAIGADGTALSELSQLDRFVTLAFVHRSLAADEWAVECACAALGLPAKAYTHAHFIGREKLTLIFADHLEQSFPYLPPEEMRSRADLVLGEHALEAYARALELDSVMLRDRPSSVRPRAPAAKPALSRAATGLEGGGAAAAARPALGRARSAAAGASSAFGAAAGAAAAAERASLARLCCALAGGLYACLHLSAVRHLLFGVLLPAAGVGHAALSILQQPPATDGEGVAGSRVLSRQSSSASLQHELSSAAALAAAASAAATADARAVADEAAAVVALVGGAAVLHEPPAPPRAAADGGGGGGGGGAAEDAESIRNELNHLRAEVRVNSLALGQVLDAVNGLRKSLTGLHYER